METLVFGILCGSLLIAFGALIVNLFNLEHLHYRSEKK